MKKLWDTKAFSSGEHDTRKGKALLLFSSHLLTILLSLFLLIVVSILALVIWTSNGGGNQKEAEQAFYDPNKPAQVATTETPASVAPDMTAQTPAPDEAAAAAEQQAQHQPQTGETLHITPTNGGTLVVEAGEGAGQIAARAGISVEELMALNPGMRGPSGEWWANPGDVVYIN